MNCNEKDEENRARKKEVKSNHMNVRYLPVSTGHARMQRRIILYCLRIILQCINSNSSTKIITFFKIKIVADSWIKI